MNFYCETCIGSNYSLSLIEAIPDPIFVIDLEYKITDINKAAIQKTEVNRQQMIGSNFSDFFTNSQIALNCCQKIFSKGSISNNPLIMKDGQLTYVLLSGSVFNDKEGNVIGAVIVARDVTEQKRIEKELIEAKVFAELTTVIAEGAKSKAEAATINAEAATSIAKEAIRTKQQFLSNMSHEIRTPMNSIVGFTKVLLKTDLTDKQREFLVAIKLSGDALIVLINDILDLAKVEAGKMIFEQTPFKMESSITSMVHLFERKIQEKNVQLNVVYDAFIPPILIGDSIRLHQIIINLLSNAVKFTSQGEITISVSIKHETEEYMTISFSISDTGIGISESSLDNIFENFQQASISTARLYGGTGLGLAIVKQLVESQGGSISVKSQLGVGSVFTFLLDFKKSKSIAIPELEIVEITPEQSSISVLVVEDMMLNQLLMKTLLEDFGFERDIASNGKIAIEKMKTAQYDIILMDLQMPEMNGFEATEYIRNTMHSNIPIIALTADVTTVDLEKCMAVGMNDYISKPIDERLLYSKIISLVKKPSIDNDKIDESQLPALEQSKKSINLDYLMHRTKSDPIIMIEMISLYLEQTPPLIFAMKESFQNKDWVGLHSAVHKLIPSFSIMGIHTDFESMAKKINDFALHQQQIEHIPNLILQLENICQLACQELTKEMQILKNAK
jgi:PAS domain S-box-containing protein